MFRWMRIFIVAVLVLALVPALPVKAQSAIPPNCQVFPLGGAIDAICMPPDLSTYNGDLVVYAHGYVSPTEPIAIPEDQLFFSDGTFIPDLINGMGYAFATTSYSENGWAVGTGLQDILQLVAFFKQQAIAQGLPEPAHVYLSGPSEGGLVTALGVEQFPDVFSGGLALCGPVGDMQKQINYWGDFRVLFDYFFPGVLPPDAMHVPGDVLANWDTGLNYEAQIQAAIQASPAKLNQLLRVSQAKYSLLDPTTKFATVDAIAWYNVFATNDGVAKFGGIPYDNQHKYYTGSANDRLLNKKVARWSESPTAKAVVKSFNTSGILKVPLVTMHTTGDPVVPYWHETIYNIRVIQAGYASKHVNIPIVRYGHCAFQASEALAGFATMVYKATGQLPPGILAMLPSATQQVQYQKLLNTAGVN